jgi:hypothetical protein
LWQLLPTRRENAATPQFPSPFFCDDHAAHLTSQKYLLQKRTKEGHLKKVETFDKIIGQGEVLNLYGPGHYVLKATKPRFNVIWKGTLGDEKMSFVGLNRKMNFTLVGLGAVAGTEAVGFGLTHVRFAKTEERLDRLETAVQLQPVQGLTCNRCYAPVNYLMQRYCVHCGTKIQWPRKPVASSINQEICSRCHAPIIARDAYCANCGMRLPLQIPYSVQ